MSNAVFPDLPGLDIERDDTPEFDTVVQRASGGRRYAMGKRLFPVWRFRLKVNVLTPADLATLQGFFLQRRGDLQDFLLRDRLYDTQATPQAFGVGDGTTTRFRLVYSRAGFIEPIGAVRGVPAITAAGSTVAASGYSIDDDGWVTFTAAPAAGAALAWTGGYYYRVAFSRPSLTFRQFLQGLHSVDGVELETVNR